MLMDRLSIYNVVVHLRKIDVKLEVEIVHKVNYLTYFKDGDYKIKIKRIIDNKNNVSSDDIGRELYSKFQEYKENFTAVSAKEISL